MSAPPFLTADVYRCILKSANVTGKKRKLFIFGRCNSLAVS